MLKARAVLQQPGRPATCFLSPFLCEATDCHVASVPNRLYSTTSPPPPEPVSEAQNPRWLSESKERIGKCITFGLNPAQTAEAGQILQEMGRDWRELVVGSDGYLTDKHRRSMHRQRVVWGEMDSMGHVNNVVYNRYAESGRVAWARNYAIHIDPENAQAWSELWTPKGEGLLLRKITTEFKFPMKYPDHVSIYHRLGSEPIEGTDTFDLHVLIVSELHQRAAARCIEDCVLYDYRKGRRTPIPSFMLNVLRQTWKLQEDAKRVNRERVRALLNRVRALETESWDRPDAVEDIGSAAS